MLAEFLVLFNWRFSMKHLIHISIFLLSACAQNRNTILQKNYTGVGKESISSNDIAQYAPQNPDAIIMKKIQLKLDIRTPGLGYLTEDGKKLYISWNVTGFNQVWKLNAPMSFPIQLTGGEDRTTIVGVTTQGIILFMRDTGGEEIPGIYMMNSNEGELHELFKKKKVQASVTYLSLDGSYFLFSANDQNPAI